jgi:hypothetical protein
MSEPKKIAAGEPPCADAALENLPEERQAEIMLYLREFGVPDTKSWLDAEGVHASKDELSEFWLWRGLRELFQRKRTMIATVLEDLKREMEAKGETISEAELFRFGQILFGARALEKEDVEAWQRIQSLRQREASLELEKTRIGVLKRRAEESLALARERFEFDAAEAVKKHHEALNAICQRSDLDDAEKREQIRLRLFGPEPE